MFGSSTTSSSPGTTPHNDPPLGSSGGSPSPPVPPPYHVYFASADTAASASSVSTGNLTMVSAPHQFSPFVTGSHVVLSQPPPPQQQQQVQLVSYGHPALSVVGPAAYGFGHPEVVSYASPAQTVVLIPSGTPPSLTLTQVAPGGAGPSPQFVIAEHYTRNPHHHHQRISSFPQPQTSSPFPAHFYVSVDAMKPGLVDQGHAAPPVTPGTEKNAHGLVVGHTYEGTIKRYNPWRGFGFVRTDSGVDIFLHHSGVLGDTTRIAVGARARFEVALVGGHRQAVKLQLLPPRKVE